jgi:hypothetical protein
MKRKICCINTEISRFITTAFPKQSRQHLIQAELLIEGQEDQSLQRLLAIFPLFLFLTQIEPTSFRLSSRKTKKERKDGYLIFRFEAKKENISLRNLAFYYKALTGLPHTTLSRRCLVL